jgi:hypothetical protein
MHNQNPQPTTTFKNLLRDPLYLGAAVLMVLIVIGVASRFLLADIPNFKPVAAIALFAAFYFRQFWVSAVAVLTVVLVSNFGLANCPWQVTTGVVGGLLVASALGYRLKQMNSANVSGIALLGNVIGSSLLMSIAFFLISNASVWMMGQWYPMTFAGLANCFLAAVPFFRFTVMGDLLFTGGLFGSYYAVIAVANYWRRNDRPVASAL